MGNFISDSINYEITSNGLSSITVGGVPKASGGLYLWDGKNFHNLNSSQSFYTEPHVLDKTNPPNNGTHYSTIHDRIQTKAVSTLNATGILVTHTYANNITVNYTYHFIDPLINVTVEIENLSDDIQITCPTVGGLTVTFDNTPSGLAYKYTQDQLINKLNPSENSRTFCAYLQDDEWGISLATHHHEMVRSLSHFDYATDSKVRTLEHFYRKTSWPQSKITYQFSICSMENPSRNTLLAQYKTDLLKFGPGRSYDILNNKWIYGQQISNSGSTNPYKLKDDARLDTSVGALVYGATQLQTLGTTGRGICIEDLGGYKYRNELSYSLWPRLIEDNVWNTKQIIAASGKEMGIYSDFHFESVRKDWTTDTTMALWPKQEPTPDAILQASNMHWIEYKLYKLEDYDLDIFYSKNSGKCYECALLAPKLKDILVDKSIYYGQGNDMAASYVGFVTTANHTNSWDTETPLEFISLMQWVFGEIDVYAQLGSVSGSPSTSFYDWALSNSIGIWATGTDQITQVTGVQSTYIDNTVGLFYKPFLYYNINDGNMDIVYNERDIDNKQGVLGFDPNISAQSTSALAQESGILTTHLKTSSGITSVLLEGYGNRTLVSTSNNTYISLSGYLDVGGNKTQLTFAPKAYYSYGVDGNFTSQVFSFSGLYLTNPVASAIISVYLYGETQATSGSTLLNFTSCDLTTTYL